MNMNRLSYTDWQDGYDQSRPLIITPARNGLAIVVSSTRLRTAALLALLALRAETIR